MAEREKRRATTFRTSRGAIVNITYPDIYVAPSIAPEDVTSPAEFREELREALREEKAPWLVVWKHGNKMWPRSYADLENGYLGGIVGVSEMANGNLLVSGTADNIGMIFELDKTTKQIVWSYGTYGVTGAGVNQLRAPWYAVEAPDGDILICDRDNTRLIKVMKSNKSIVWTFNAANALASFGEATFIPFFVEVQPDGHYLVSCATYVAQFNPATNVMDWKITGFSSTRCARRIWNTEPSRAGWIVVADYNNNTMSVYNAARVLQLTIGQAGLEGVCQGFLISPEFFDFASSVSVIVPEHMQAREVSFIDGIREGFRYGVVSAFPPYSQDYGYGYGEGCAIDIAACIRLSNGNFLFSDYYGQLTEVKPVKYQGDQRPQNFSNQIALNLVTTALEQYSSVVPVGGYPNKTFHVRNTEDVAVTVRVYACLNYYWATAAGNWVQIGADQTLAIGSVTPQNLMVSIPDEAPFLRLAFVGVSTVGNVNAWVAASRNA